MSYVDTRSVLHRLDAFVKLSGMLLLVVSVILSDTMIGYLLVVTAMFLFIRLSKIGIRKACGGVQRLWLFFIIILLMNAWFFEGEKVLVSWWIFRLSEEGIRQGLTVVIRVVLIMILGNLLTSVTTPLEITGAFRTLLYPLKYLYLPVQDIAMILGVAIQFIPTFVEEANMIRKAQTARGAQFESRKLLERAKSLLPLVVPMFISAFRRADELSVAMEARGYRKGRGGYAKSRTFSTIDLAAIGICICICVAEIFI